MKQVSQAADPGMTTERKSPVILPGKALPADLHGQSIVFRRRSREAAFLNLGRGILHVEEKGSDHFIGVRSAAKNAEGTVEWLEQPEVNGLYRGRLSGLSDWILY